MRLEDEIRLRVQYEGEARQSADDFVTADEVVLRADAAWLPTLPDTLGTFDVTVRHPDDFRVYGQGVAHPTSTEDGWVTTRWVIDGEDGFTLYGAPAYATQRTTVGAAELEVAVWPSDSALLGEVSAVAAASWTKVVDVLGPYPFAVARLVETGWNDGRSGYGAVSNVSIGWRSIREGVSPQFVAHELSHGWWGGMVPLAQEARSLGQWNESFAEYTSALALDEAGALALRQRWSRGYASLKPDMDRPMLQVGTASANWDVHKAVTYQKGALVLTALEDRIGRGAMWAFVTAFAADRAGKASTWADVLAVLERREGPEDAAWLRAWLASPSAPSLRLDALGTEGGKLVGRVLQGDATRYAGQVQLGLYAEDVLKSTVWVDFGVGETAFSVRAPKGTSRVVLDPYFRLPRCPPVDGQAGIEVRLGAEPLPP
jgi:hypothetical protein